VRAQPSSYAVSIGSLPGVKRGVSFDLTPLFSVEFKERVELYLYSPSVPSWHVIG